MMSIENFFVWAKQINDFPAQSYDELSIYFSISDKEFLKTFLEIADKSDNFVSVHKIDSDILYRLHCTNPDGFKDQYELYKKNKKQGLPDLTWATCKQIGSELKKRQNLTFVLFWTEENSTENISVEASGQANTVVGLATRGLSLLLKATEARTKYENTTDED